MIASKQWNCPRLRYVLEINNLGVTLFLIRQLESKRLEIITIENLPKQNWYPLM